MRRFHQYLLVGGMCLLMGVVPVGAATFTVNSTADVVDATPGDGVCDDGAGSCTLRAAIMESNALAGADTIAFNIPGPGPHTIQPVNNLPPITDPVVIDGYTQPGASPNTNPVGLGLNTVLMIEIDGSLLGGIVPTVLNIVIDNTTVRGLVINRVASVGIDMRQFGFPGPSPLIGNNIVEGNFIGTDVTGNVALGPFGNHVGVAVGTGNNRIGGVTPAARNLISGNGFGIVIAGPDTDGNVVQGNLIGTDITGTVALGNIPGNGVSLGGGAGTNNLVGGTAPGARNVISGNGGTGVVVGVANGNRVEGNFIGTDITGTVALGNINGVFISSSDNNTIGGTAPGAGNVISGNIQQGVIIQLGSGNRVQGNFIGTDITGTAALGNDFSGVFLAGFANNNTIGGTAPGAGNVISGNRTGVRFASFANANIVQGNLIGTDISGNAALGNTFGGVVLEFLGSSSNNLIGGDAPGAGNVISGNGFAGVRIGGVGITGNVVAGNLIGTNASGTAALGNVGNGVNITAGAANNTVGGTAPGVGNVIAHNTGAGVHVGSITSTENRIQGNSIHSNGGLGIDLGAALAGDGVTANDLGDGDTGSNNLQNFPVVTAASTGGGIVTAEGTLNSTPFTSFRLEFFANSVADLSGFGEGETFVGATDVITDAAGDASFAVLFPASVPAGQFITATATDANNNTSEFSGVVTAEPGTPDVLIQAIIAAVGNLVAAGVLDQDTGEDLLEFLVDALVELQQEDTEDTEEVVEELVDFIDDVDELISEGELSPEQGDPLIDAAQAVIAQLTP